MDSQTLTVARVAKTAERAAKDAGWGNTDAGLGLAARYLPETSSLVSTARQYLKINEHRDNINQLPSDLIALCGITTAISGIIEGLTVSRVTLTLGAALENECFGIGLTEWDETRAAHLTKTVLKSHRNQKYRRTALRSLAQKAAFPWTRWTSSEKAKAGRWLLEVLLETPLFVWDADGTLGLTEEASDAAAAIVSDLQARHPVLLPLQVPPEPWVKSHAMIDGYRVPLVRSRDKVVQQNIAAAIRSGVIAESLEALNAAQCVAYRINTPILEVVQWCYDNNVKVSGLPPRADLELPTRLPDDADESALKLNLKARSEIRQLNRSFIGERLTYLQDIDIAKHLSDGPFWTPLNWDYRGRIYGISRFNFQRQDYVRSMFNFEQGCEMDEDSWYWLKVHIANCGDFGKVSKKPFADRVKWVETNISEIISYGQYPTKNLGWTEADKPFLFLAGCYAYCVALLLNRCHLPISFDGSCSGLQHLGAMTRDENTATLVNLTNNEVPNDVYQVVADLAARVVQADASASPDVDVQEVANACLAAGINRKLVKRNVMTFSYSSKTFGMGEQHMEDTMVPLGYDVLRGVINKHPYETSRDTFTSKDGHAIHVPGLYASKYLAKTVYGAIKETVRRPAEAMAFLQGIAKVMSHEAKPVVWHTPLGFPVTLRYTNVDTRQLNLYLHDKGVKVRLSPRVQVELPGIDKRRASSAIAPSFVHALDACHLMATVVAAKDDGITSVALVHDSFGCLPADAGRFRTIIKQSFVDVYKTNDVLFDILRESAAQLTTEWQRLPELPVYGTYDINSIMEADYAFA